jgi:hypothetical protein
MMTMTQFHDNKHPDIYQIDGMSPSVIQALMASGWHPARNFISPLALITENVEIAEAAAAIYGITINVVNG